MSNHPQERVDNRKVRIEVENVSKKVDVNSVLKCK